LRVPLRIVARRESGKDVTREITVTANLMDQAFSLAIGWRISGHRCGSLAWCGLRQPCPAVSLPLLFGTKIAFNGVRPHRHRASVHLLLRTSALEPPGRLTLSKLVPSLGLPKPFPPVHRVGFGPFAVHQFHSPAICHVAHGLTPRFARRVILHRRRGEKRQGD
jgi:hypothetical protein